MLVPTGDMPVIKVKSFHGEDYIINEWLESMRAKIRVLDIQISRFKTMVIYQDFTGQESGRAVFSDEEKDKAFTS